MSELIRGINVWKMALLKALLICTLSGCNNFASAMEGVEWGDLTPTQKTKLYNGMFIALGTSLVAFLDRSMQRASQGKTILETGTTQFLQKP